MNPELSQIKNSNIVLSPLINKALKNKTIKPLGERKEAVRRQELMVLLGNVAVVSSGLSVALPSATLPQLKDPNDIYQLNTEECSWFASISSVSCPIGSLLIGYLMDRIGRKHSALLSSFGGIIGWITVLTASYQNSKQAIYIQFLIGRFITGLVAGAVISPIGAYAAEISLPSVRARLLMASPIIMAFGILLMYFFGFLLRGKFQLTCSIALIIQIIGFACILPLPESPMWLLQMDKTERARKSLKYFRGLSKSDKSTYNEEFESELALIKKSSDKNRIDAENESLLQTIRAPEVYKPICVMIGFFFVQQFSGLSIVIIFAAPMAESAGVAIDPMLVAVFFGIARLITTFFMGTILERWGRRPAAMLSAAGMSACMLLLAANSRWPIIGKQLPLLPIIAIVVHIIFVTLGILPIPFLMLSEVFPQRVRGSASGLTLFIGLSFSFAVIKLYPTVQSFIGTSNTFCSFGVISLLAVLYIYCFVPETKGRTLLEIENYFRTGRAVTNAQVTRRESQIATELAKGVYSSQYQLETIMERLSMMHEDCETNEKE